MLARALCAGGFRHLEYLMHSPSREILRRQFGRHGLTDWLRGCTGPLKNLQGKGAPSWQPRECRIQTSHFSINEGLEAA